MAAQQGFQYERNTYELLKEFNLVPANFRPAGASSNAPDLMLDFKGRQTGCELKITDASAGSLVIKYNDKNRMPWGFNDIKGEDAEKIFIRDVAIDSKVIEQINKAWAEVPMLRERDELWKATVGKLPPRKRYEHDHATFKEIKGVIPTSKIEEYYLKKDCPYINIGTHGFYMMGTDNPYKLKDVPRFADSASASYRARVQYKGSDTYQFVFEMTFSMKKKSEYNIAPLASKTGVNIQRDKLNLSCFI